MPAEEVADGCSGALCHVKQAIALHGNLSCMHAQGGKIQIGAPTGRWLLIVVYRGKHDPVSRNYLVALGQAHYPLLLLSRHSDLDTTA